MKQKKDQKDCLLDAIDKIFKVKFIFNNWNTDYDSTIFYKKMRIFDDAKKNFLTMTEWPKILKDVMEI